MKESIIIYLLIISFSLKNAFESEFGIYEEVFIYGDRSFKYTFNEDGCLFVQAEYKENNYCRLDLKTYDDSLSQSILLSPGVATIIPFKKGIPVKIGLKKESNYNGQVLIWMNPSTQEIKLNILQSYRWKYNCMVTDIVDKIYELTYSINKAEKDAILELSYNKNMKIDEDYFASNPFKIIHNNRNVTGITNYEIRKGESYKIIASVFYKKLNTNPPTYMHYLPSFLFEFANVKGKEPEFGKEISFDINNNNLFKTTFSEDGR